MIDPVGSTSSAGVATIAQALQASSGATRDAQPPAGDTGIDTVVDALG